MGSRGQLASLNQHLLSAQCALITPSTMLYTSCMLFIFSLFYDINSVKVGIFKTTYSTLLLGTCVARWGKIEDKPWI